MIDFVVVSSDLWPSVLDTQIKREAELSTNHDFHGNSAVKVWLRKNLSKWSSMVAKLLVLAYILNTESAGVHQR